MHTASCNVTAADQSRRCFNDKRPVYLFILHFPPVALTLPIITRFWQQPHAALFAMLALHSMWRPYPEVHVLVSACSARALLTFSHTSSFPGFAHFSHVFSPAAAVAGNGLHTSILHHLSHLRFCVCPHWCHVVGVGDHWRRQRKLCVWRQV